MKVSFSAISTYMNCTSEYAYKYRDGLRVVRPSAHFETGSIVHGALELILSAHAVGERLPDSTTAVQHACAQLREKRGMSLDSEEFAELSIRMLDYHVIRMDLDRWETLILAGEPAVELALTVPFEGAALQAHIDWIARSKDNGKVYVIDHKTSKHRLNAQPFVENNLQLALYLHAYNETAHTNAWPHAQGAMLHQMCTTPPNAVEPLKKGRSKATGLLFSSAKSQRTSWERYCNALVQHGEDPANYLDIRDMLLDLESKSPFRRWTPDVTTPAGHDAMIDLARNAVRKMRAIKEEGAPALPGRVSDWTCGRCEYLPWCDAVLAGRDPRSLVLTVYQPDKNSRYSADFLTESIDAHKEHIARESHTGRYDMHRWTPHG